MTRLYRHLTNTSFQRFLTQVQLVPNRRYRALLSITLCSPRMRESYHRRSYRLTPPRIGPFLTADQKPQVPAQARDIPKSNSVRSVQVTTFHQETMLLLPCMMRLVQESSKRRWTANARLTHREKISNIHPALQGSQCQAGRLAIKARVMAACPIPYQAATQSLVLRHPL